MTLDAWSTIVNAVAWTLLHACWQVVAIHAVYMLARRAVRHATPERRYVVGLVALLAIVAALAITFALQVQRPSGRNESVPSPLHASGVDGPTSEEIEITIDPLGRQRVSSTAAASVYNRVAVSVEPYFPLLVMAWAGGCGVMSTLHVVGLFSIRRLLARCYAASVHDVARWASIARRIGVHRAVSYLTSSEITTPLTVGWIKPAVLMPAYVSTQFSIAQMDAMVAHELAHVRRLDYVVNHVQAVLESILYFHPSLWLLAGLVRRDRELCCDRMAVRESDDPRPLATALARLAELRQAPLSKLTNALVAGSLVERIAALANRSANGRTNIVTLTLTLLLGGGCLAAIGADVHERATLYREVKSMRTTHESVFVADLLSVPPARDGFKNALIAALQATRSRVAPDDARYADLVAACQTGVDFDLVWYEYLMINTRAAYPTIRAEYPDGWSFETAGTQRQLSRILWQRATTMPAGPTRTAWGRAALSVAAMRREVSSLPALATIASDTDLEIVAGLRTSEAWRLRRFASVSQEAIAASVAAARRYKDALDRGAEHNASTYLPAAFACGDRLPEIGFFVTAVTNQSPPTKVKASGLRWLRTMTANDGVVQRHLALGTTPGNQAVVRSISGATVAP